MIFDIGYGVDVAGVFVIVTVKTEVFPVTSIGWIIVVVMIFMVYGQFVQILAGEFTPASPAHPRMNF